MTAAAAATACLAVVVMVGVVPTRRAGHRRLVSAVGSAVPRRPEHAGAAGNRRGPGWGAAMLAGVAAGLVTGGWVGVAVGVAAAVGCAVVLRRLPSAAERAEQARCAADLPLAADLTAAALRAGAPVDHAITAVAAAVGGPLGERLGRVGRALRLGTPPVEAWQYVDDVAGARRLAAAAVRSADSGAALAGALVRLADDVRADRVVAFQAAAQRAGVLVVLPLGLCFLPAFILAGVVPVVVAVVGDVFLPSN